MTATNIEITVNFDRIVKKITPIKSVYHLNKLESDKYVTYSGKPVNGSTITLTQNDEYTFTLEAAKGNKCTATKLESFHSQDGHLAFESDTNELQLKCIAETKDTSGVNVTLTVTFNDQNKVGWTAQWDPKIKVIGGI